MQPDRIKPTDMDTKDTIDALEAVSDSLRTTYDNLETLMLARLTGEEYDTLRGQMRRVESSIVVLENTISALEPKPESK